MPELSADPVVVGANGVVIRIGSHVRYSGGGDYRVTAIDRDEPPFSADEPPFPMVTIRSMSAHVGDGLRELNVSPDMIWLSGTETTPP